MNEPVQALTKCGTPFCTFDDCAWYNTCGLRVTEELKEIARSEGVPIATYKKRPMHCFKGKPEEEE